MLITEPMGVSQTTYGNTILLVASAVASQNDPALFELKWSDYQFQALDIFILKNLDWWISLDSSLFLFLFLHQTNLNFQMIFYSNTRYSILVFFFSRNYVHLFILKNTEIYINYIFGFLFHLTTSYR